MKAEPQSVYDIRFNTSNEIIITGSWTPQEDNRMYEIGTVDAQGFVPEYFGTAVYQTDNTLCDLGPSWSGCRYKGAVLEYSDGGVI
jgi:hypothetical protein